jgi:nicotinate phosphoribosyltransferase
MKNDRLDPDRPVITSILDQDFYKITMGQVVFNQFSEAKVTYRFTNRGGTRFPPGFVDRLQKQINYMADLKMTDGEYEFLKGIRFLKPTYLEWLKNYQYNPDEVRIGYPLNLGGMVPIGDVEITIHGSWFRVIFWEVVFMAIVSELNFRDKQFAPDWKDRIAVKATKMQNAGVNWLDFGTRRRASYETQDAVVEIMKEFKGFRGTSNVHLAHKHGVKAQGTNAHEMPMAMQAKYGARMSNQMALDHWAREYGGDLGIMLPDTLTTKIFMDNLSRRDAKLYDGARQDSGNLVEAANLYIDRLIKFDIDPMSKILVPSDSLTDDLAIDFHREFEGKVKGDTAGIGTFLSNDVLTTVQKKQGIKPLNMVIKMADADFGYGKIPVVKLSDVKGKNTGEPDQVEHVKKELGL